MVLLAFTLLLSISLHGCVSTTTYNMNGLQSIPDAQMTADVCQDCTKIFELLVDMVSDTDLQRKIMDTVEDLCAHLPGPTADMCKDQVEKMFPIAINFLTSVAKPEQICQILGLCSSCGKQEKMLSYLIQETFKLSAAGDSMEPKSSCAFCTFLVQTLESMLPKERTEEAVTKLLQQICRILPPAVRGQCQAIIGKFSKTVIDAIVGYATPETVCALMGMCRGEEAPIVEPCTLAAYRCRDVKTALKCGSFFFCQRYVWKNLNYDTI
ncbi:surfactant protein Ba [Pholidichthys leucotaenia]